MALESYRQKRRFKKSPEPEGGEEVDSKSLNRFVVQKHQASHLHYDFRLELPENISGGAVVLKSWAVPKGPPEKKGEKRLAVAVENHPVAYLNFQGTIPEGEYGAGTVEIWDRGKFTLLERTKDRIKIELNGEKLKGVYTLVQPKTFAQKDWLLIAG